MLQATTLGRPCGYTRRCNSHRGEGQSAFSASIATRGRIVADTDQAGDRIQAWVTRALHSRRATWWYHLVARIGAAQFISFIVASFVITGIQTIRGFHPFGEGSDTEYALAFKLSPVGALLEGLFSYRTMKDREPPEKRPPRWEWRKYAERAALPVAIGVGWVILLLLFLLVGGGTSLLGKLSQLPQPLAATVGTILVGFMVLGLVVLAYLPPVAFEACRDQELAMLEAEAPPQLLVAMDLNARAETFRYRAEALEEALEEATGLSDQLRHEIQLQQEQLSQLRQEYARQMELSKLTPEQVSAVTGLLSRQQEQGARRALLSNIALGFLFYIAGVVTPALISSDALGEQLRRWFHLG